MYLNFTTQRLDIKPIAVTDANFMLQLTNSKGWLEFIGDRQIYTLDDAEKYILKIRSNPNYFYHVFQKKDANIPIGIITFLKRDDEHYPDFGFAILPKFEGKGFVFEASKMYLDEILKSKKDDKIIAITLKTNQKSIRLLEKLGFQFLKFKNDDEKWLYYQLIK